MVSRIGSSKTPAGRSSMHSRISRPLSRSRGHRHVSRHLGPRADNRTRRSFSSSCYTWAMWSASGISSNTSSRPLSSGASFPHHVLFLAEQSKQTGISRASHFSHNVSAKTQTPHIEAMSTNAYHSSRPNFRISRCVSRCARIHLLTPHHPRHMLTEMRRSHSSLTTSVSNKSTACACDIPRGVPSRLQNRWRRTNATRPISSKRATKSKRSRTLSSPNLTPGLSLCKKKMRLFFPHDIFTTPYDDTGLAFPISFRLVCHAKL